jgi:hypothetical protein
MFNKLKKIPDYLIDLSKRSKTIGCGNMLRELIRYNRFYYRLLKENKVKVNLKTVVYHTAFYAKVVHLFPHISTEELLKIIPRSITHGIYEKLNINRREITYDKHKMYERMVQNDIQVPQIYLVTDSKNNCLIEKKPFAELLLLSSNQRVLAKPRFANGGKGIHLLSSTDVLLPDYIYQAFVYNHKEIIELQGSDFCGTVRYIVYNKSKENQVPVAASIQLNTGSITDHMMHGGSISASVDVKTGRLSTVGIDKTGKSIEKNPISGKTLFDFQIPMWDKALQLIEKTCLVYSELPLIAFDIAITDKGPILLEINAGCGTVAAQFDKGWLEHPFVTDNYRMSQET